MVGGSVETGKQTAAHAGITTGARVGKRAGPNEAAFPNALIAKIYGMTYKYGTAAQTAADFSKLALLDTRTVLDPIGNELNSSNGPIPTRELIYRGYYDTRPIFSMAACIRYHRGRLSRQPGIRQWTYRH
jgi:hypothetical protein